MPTVPVQPNLISSDVPGATNQEIGTAGVLGDQTARTGATIANAGFGFIEDAKKAEAVDASSKAYYQDRFDSEDKIATLKRTNPDGYMRDPNGEKTKNADGTDRTVTQEYTDWANHRYTQQQQNMPSQMAQQLYTQRAGQYFSDSQIAVKNDEWVMRTQSFLRGLDDTQRAVSNRLVDTPDTSSAYSYLDNMRKDLRDQQGKLLSPQQVNDRDKVLLRDVPDSLFRGYYNQALAEPSGGQTRADRVGYALAVLYGGRAFVNADGSISSSGATSNPDAKMYVDPDSLRRKQIGAPTFSGIMDPDQKAQTEQNLIRLYGIAKTADANDIHAKTSAAVDQASMNAQAGLPPPNVQPLISQWDQLLSEKSTTPFIYAQNVGGLMATSQGTALMSSPAYILASPQEKQVQVNKLGDDLQTLFQQRLAKVAPQEAKDFPYVGAGIRQQFQTDLERQAKTSDSQANDDFAKFAKFDSRVNATHAALAQAFENPTNMRQSAPVLQDYLKQVQSLGKLYFNGDMTKVKPLEQADAQSIAHFLTDRNTPYGQSSEALLSLRDAAPQQYNAIINQMVEEKKLSADWRLALIIPDRILGTDLIRTIKDKDQIIDSAKDTMAANNVTMQSVSKAVGGYTQPYIAGIAQSSANSGIGIDEQNLMNSLVTTKAIELYKQSGGYGKIDTYAKEATEAVFGTRYRVNPAPSIFSNGAKVPSIHPAMVGGFPTTPSNDANINASAQYTMSPEGAAKAGIAPPELRPGQVSPLGDERTKIFYDQLRSTGRPVMNSDQTGFRLQYYDKERASWVYALTTQKDQYGNQIPFSMKYTDAQKPMPQAPGLMDTMSAAGSSLLDKVKTLFNNAPSGSGMPNTKKATPDLWDTDRSPQSKTVADFTKFDDLIFKHASDKGVDPGLLKGILLNESKLGQDPRVAAGLADPKNVEGSKSRDGKSWGLGQLKPSTAADYDPSATPQKLNEADYNIGLTAQHLARLNRVFGGNEESVVKGYQQGEGNQIKSLAAGTSSAKAESYYAQYKKNRALIKGRQGI